MNECMQNFTTMNETHDCKNVIRFINEMQYPTVLYLYWSHRVCNNSKHKRNLKVENHQLTFGFFVQVDPIVH